MKEAVISIDVEDWYHLDYFDAKKCITSYSMLDGLDKFIEVIEKYNITSTFFVLGEIAEKNIQFYRDLVARGYDIGSHGWDHRRPMSMTIKDFQLDLDKSLKVLREINSHQDFGYRAPCFSIDRERLNIVKENFGYSSSKINFSTHPLYGSLDMKGFKEFEKNIFVKDQFLEFEVTTSEIFGKNFPISGGGYLRIIPHIFIKNMIKRYITRNNLFVFYIHPFELSSVAAPELPINTKNLTKFRFKYGRSSMVYKLEKLIDLLGKHNYKFTTFRDIKKIVISNQ